MSQEIYSIIDLEGYATQIREAAAASLSENDAVEENLDDFISVNQIINMVNDQCLGYDDNDRPILDEDTNEKIFEDTSVWIHNVGLAKLAAQDLVECAWDDEYNEMIFWSKEKKVKNESKSRRKNTKDKR